MTFEQMYLEYFTEITEKWESGKLTDEEAVFLVTKLNEWDTELTRKISDGTVKEDDDE